MNKVTEKIDLIDGEFKQLRPSIKVRAVDSNGDQQTADIIAGMVRHIETASNARSAYNHSHTSTLYCGRGAWRIDVEDDEDDPFVRQLRVSRIPNVFSVVVDPEAKKADRSDANYVFVTQWLSEEEFKSEYPDEDISDWPTDDTWAEWASEKMRLVAEYWWKESVTKTYIRVIRGTREITIEEDKKLVTDKPVKDKKPRKVKRHQVKWCKMVANKILKGVDGTEINDWPGKYIPIIFQAGKEVNVHGQTKTRGMVRFVHDPQTMYNYWASAATEQVALQPKNPYLLSAGMINGFEDIWDAAATSNYFYLPYNSDQNNPGGRPAREAPPMMSTAYADQLNRMEHDIMSAMGVYQASLGDKSNETSGIAIENRQRQGNIGTYSYTDSFQNSLLFSTQVLIDMIPYVYDTERIVRIIGDDGEEKEVPVNVAPSANNPNFAKVIEYGEEKSSPVREGITEFVNDITVGKYDVALSIGPSYTTQREEALSQLLELVKVAPQIGQAAMDLIIENMDLPQSQKLIERVKKLIPPQLREREEGEEQPQQEQQPDPALMIELKKLQLAEREQDRKDYETKIKEFEVQVKSIAEMMKAEAAEMGQQTAKMTAFMKEIRDNFQAAHGAQATQQDLALKEQQAMQAQQGAMPEGTM